VVSFHSSETGSDVPRLISKPASAEGVPSSPPLRTIILSPNSIVSELTVVVVPSTRKSPAITTVPVVAVEAGLIVIVLSVLEIVELTTVKLPRSNAPISAVVKLRVERPVIWPLPSMVIPSKISVVSNPVIESSVEVSA
jgi:hypothetical protein